MLWRREAAGRLAQCPLHALGEHGAGMRPPSFQFTSSSGLTLHVILHGTSLESSLVIFAEDTGDDCSGRGPWGRGECEDSLRDVVNVDNEHCDFCDILADVWWHSGASCRPWSRQNIRNWGCSSNMPVSCHTSVAFFPTAEIMIPLTRLQGSMERSERTAPSGNLVSPKFQVWFPPTFLDCAVPSHYAFLPPFFTRGSQDTVVQCWWLECKSGDDMNVAVGNASICV